MSNKPGDISRRLMDLEQQFSHVLQRRFPFVLERTAGGRLRPVLLAISGGMDSMILARLLQRVAIPAVWVHCNFHLRGEQSDRDAAFVTKQAATAGVPLIIKEFDTLAESRLRKLSIEETAREQRYSFFGHLLEQDDRYWAEVYKFRQPADPALTLSPRFIMTAHHGGDQIETLLLNLFRGTGISGLHGIPFKNKQVLRPLLEFKKSDLVQYASDRQLLWVEDHTNQLTDYTRNYLRLEVLPVVKKQYPFVEDTLLANIRRFTEAESLYQQGLERYKRRLFVYKDQQLHLSILLLQKSGIAATLLWEALKEYGFGARQLPEIEKLLVAGTGAYQDNPQKTYRVLRNRAHLIVTALAPQRNMTVVIADGQQEAVFAEGRLEINKKQRFKDQKGDLMIDPDPSIAQLDTRQLSFPLLLRKWQPGDYFYPLGMGKKKKVSRFLTDRKLGLHEKQRVWVLESQGRIIWVVGLRLDHRFKITAATREYLSIHFITKT